jgi:predicted Zn-dependent peptidase
MTSSSVLHRQFDNGLVLIGEPMPWLRSAAFSLLLPAGTCYEPTPLDGLASMACEMVQRGCGPWDSRAFLERLDFLGVQHSSNITTHHASFGCAMPSSALADCLHVFSQLVQSPHLPESQLQDSRSLCLQDLRALDDEPSHRCFSELKRFRFSSPFGRISQGTLEGLESIDYRSLRDFVSRQYTPQGSVLAVAGNFDWSQCCDTVESLLGDWKGPQPPTLPRLHPVTGSRHIDHTSSQTHLALAYSSAAYGDPAYYQARALVGVLSDGMSSRLFTELREKRGLVYSVFAQCLSLAGQGNVLCYAGTTTSRAEETLVMLMQTIDSLGQGVLDDELERLKNRIKTALIFEQESCVARSNQIASDWFHLGRVPMREEVVAQIDGLTVEQLLRYFEEHRPGHFSLVTVGSQPLELPEGVAQWSY